MKKSNIIFAILVLIVGMAMFLLTSAERDNTETKKYSKGDVLLGGRIIAVEIAETVEQRSLGLGGREQICLDCGMLFIFDRPDRYGFWMKGMEFPLDILWISSDKTVVHIEKNIPANFPNTMKSPLPAQYVLEINAGLADKYGISVGDQISLP